MEYQFLLSKVVCVKGHGMLTGSWQFDECKLEKVVYRLGSATHKIFAKICGFGIFMGFCGFQILWVFVGFLWVFVGFFVAFVGLKIYELVGLIFVVRNNISRRNSLD